MTAPDDTSAELLRQLENLGANAPYRAARNGPDVGVVNRRSVLVTRCPDEREARMLATQLNIMCGATRLPVLGPCSPWQAKGAVH